MRSLLWLGVLALSGCGLRGSGVSTGSAGSVGTDVDGSADEQCIELDRATLSFSQSQLTGVVELTNNCGYELQFGAELDDPQQAFAIDSDGAIVPAQSTTELELSLVASEPGDYEAQLHVDLGQASGVVDLIGSLPGAQ